MELGQKEQMYVAIGFGSVLIIIALLITLFGGRSTLTCIREANNHGKCVYKVQSILNQDVKTFEVSQLESSKVKCNTSRNLSSGGNSTNCKISLNILSQGSRIDMAYGISKYEGKILTQNDEINKYVKDLKIQKLKITQENLLIIGVTSSFFFY